ncbi:MAG: TetR/AcrR family transcriptional regulator C-terminal domain-containing protein [Polyangiaceae bacterium]
MEGSKRRPPLSRRRILEEALGVVDREGLSALSMRRLGDRLGVEAMSLYHHLPNKAALLDGIFEAVLEELPTEPSPGPWQERLVESALALRQVLVNHPNALALFATRPAVTPASLGHVERVLALLDAAGFSRNEALTYLNALVALVVGHTIATATPRAPSEAPAADYAALDPARFRHVREAASLLPTQDPRRELELAIETLVRGMELRRRQASRANQRAPAASPKRPKSATTSTSTRNERELMPRPSKVASKRKPTRKS